MSSKLDIPLNAVEDRIMSRQGKCFRVSANDVYCSSVKRRRTGMDLTTLSPLLLQFLAWNDYCTVEKELKEAQHDLTPEMREALIQAQKEFASNAVETHHINPITPNYSVIPPANHHGSDSKRQRGSSSAQTTSTGSSTTTTSTHENKSYSSEYVEGSDEPFRKNVPQDSKYAQLVGFKSHTVMLEIRTTTNVIGRLTNLSKPDLDLSPVVLHPRRVSHSHLAIEWDAEHAQFRVNIMSSNGAVIDGKIYHEGKVDVGNGSIIRVQNFDMTLVLPKDMTPPQ